jgi:hypothetical protein
MMATPPSGPLVSVGAALVLLIGSALCSTIGDRGVR